MLEYKIFTPVECEYQTFVCSFDVMQNRCHIGHVLLLSRCRRYILCYAEQVSHWPCFVVIKMSPVQPKLCRTGVTLAMFCCYQDVAGTAYVMQNRCHIGHVLLLSRCRRYSLSYAEQVSHWPCFVVIKMSPVQPKLCRTGVTLAMFCCYQDVAGTA